MTGDAPDRWIHRLADALTGWQRPDGGWAYYAPGESATEPTALAVAALWGLTAAPAAVARGLDFLASQQVDGGALRPAPSYRDATALSALAGVVLARCGEPRHAQVAAQVADALLAWEPQSWKSTADDRVTFGNDTQLKGFCWTPETYSWVEPTAYGVLLCDGLHRGTLPRVVESRRLLVDRAIPSGGWNYGNPKVFGTVLEPDAMTTAIAIVALLDDASRPCVQRGADFLRRVGVRQASAVTAGWSMAALRALGDDPPADALPGLIDGAQIAHDSPWHAALAILATLPAVRHPLIDRGRGATSAPAAATNGAAPRER
ncbi:MAG: hypothetical protein U1A27_05720 [Phycisphaerae bacterium]